MKNVQIFIQKGCPYCIKALAWLKELQAEDARYAGLIMTFIDELEQPALADKYDYWYVPTIYVDGKKVHEGAASKEKVKKALDAAL